MHDGMRDMTRVGEVVCGCKKDMVRVEEDAQGWKKRVVRLGRSTRKAQ